MENVKIMGIFLILVLCSCRSGQDTSNSETKDNKVQEGQMIRDGYEKAVVMKMPEETGCNFILNIIDTELRLDPINLKRENKKDGQEVMVKYRRLRMPQRCEDAIPVELSEIKKV